jgi:hypothetical protein
MTANTAPIYSKQGNLSSDGTSTTSSAMAPTLTTAAADTDGSSSNNKCAFTAGSNGALLRKLRLKSKGTNVATVARFYINNGGVNTSAANNSFVGEISLPATTASATAATVDMDYDFGVPNGLPLDPSFRIFVGLGTTVSAGWVVTPLPGGQY